MAGTSPEYWEERQKVWKTKAGWQGVENIFIDDEP